jgi:hypothetical protein
MKKIFLSLVVFMTLLVTAQAQTSTHQDNVKTVTDAYWTFLERQPDAGGLQFWTYQLDTGQKDSKTLAEAFKLSTEYGQVANHSVFFKANYTTKFNFNAVRNTKPTELITVRAKWGIRDLIENDNSADPLTTFLGNAVIFDTNDEHTYVVWFDFTKLDLHNAISLASEMGSPIDITFDPVSGLATSIVVR